MDLGSLRDALDRNLQYLGKLESGSCFRLWTASIHVPASDGEPGRIHGNDQNRFRDQRFERKGQERLLISRRQVEWEECFLQAISNPSFKEGSGPDSTSSTRSIRKPMTSSRLTFRFLMKSSKAKALSAESKEKALSPITQDSRSQQGWALAGRNLELAWLKDPVDVAFLQIQGSGRLDLGEGRATPRRLCGKKRKNGHPIARLGGIS